MCSSRSSRSGRNSRSGRSRRFFHSKQDGRISLNKGISGWIEYQCLNWIHMELVERDPHIQIIKNWLSAPSPYTRKGSPIYCSRLALYQYTVQDEHLLTKIQFQIQIQWKRSKHYKYTIRYNKRDAFQYTIRWIHFTLNKSQGTLIYDSFPSQARVPSLLKY